MLFFRSVVLVACLMVVSGCGVFRGIPSHGGGKRFDEEQRVVSGAIRQAVAQMDLQDIAGKRVRIEPANMAHSGGASIRFPGPETANIWAELRSNSYRNDLSQPGRQDYDAESSGTGASMTYRLNEYYSPHGSYTNEDLTYLLATLDMKARHDGLMLAGSPEVILYVLVDVLGTNRSRQNLPFNTRDRLAATCELTYYAQDAKTGELIFRTRRASAGALYQELRTLGSTHLNIQRGAYPTEPTAMQLDDTSAATSQPVDPANHIDPNSAATE